MTEDEFVAQCEKMRAEAAAKGMRWVESFPAFVMVPLG